jgi:hypothetical protein
LNRIVDLAAVDGEGTFEIGAFHTTHSARIGALLIRSNFRSWTNMSLNLKSTKAA